MNRLIPSLAGCLTLAAGLALLPAHVSTATPVSPSSAELPITAPDARASRTVAVSTVESITLSGTTSRIATLSLRGGTPGETVFAIDPASSETSQQQTFNERGGTSVAIPVTAGAVTLLELHVFPAPGQTGSPYVHPVGVDDSPTSAFAPRIAGVTFSGDPIRARIRFTGLLPGRPLTATNLSTGEQTSRAEIGSGGDAAFELGLAAGRDNQIEVRTWAEEGERVLAIQIDGDQTSSTPAIPAPTTEIVESTTARSLIQITGMPNADVVVADASGTRRAGSRLDSSGTAVLSLGTPANQATYRVVQVVGDEQSLPSTVVLSPGVGTVLPAQTVSTADADEDRRVVLLTIQGERGALVTVTDIDGEILAKRLFGPAGETSVRLPLSAGFRGAFVTQSRVGVSSEVELVRY